MGLPTISVLDGTGAAQTVNRLASGRNVAADSAGVVLSTEDLAQLAAIVTAVNAVTTAAGIVPILGRTTREYDESLSAAQVFVTVSTAAIALPTLGASRELRLNTLQRCYIKFGTSGVGAATTGAGSMPIEIGQEVIVVRPTATHYRVIRDTADGTLHLTPVA